MTIFVIHKLSLFVSFSLHVALHASLLQVRPLFVRNSLRDYLNVVLLHHTSKVWHNKLLTVDVHLQNIFICPLSGEGEVVLDQTDAAFP